MLKQICFYYPNEGMKYVSIKDLYNDLFKGKKTESEALKEKENFLAMLTHDLKTPIRAQIRALELLLNNYFGPLNSKQREIIEEILASNQYMQNLAENILLDHKLENGKLVIKTAKNDIKLTIENTIKSLKFILLEKNQKTNVQFKDIEDTICNYDDIEIKRVLTNLIINASEYGFNNSKINILVEKEANNFKITISNKGIEITNEDINSLFNKYSTNSKNYRKAGAGLGLYICKIIIAAHGGTIEVKKQNEGITSFIFTLNSIF